MFQLYPWPNVILHLDGDSFFASVAQAVNPRLKNKPVVTGQERGIATAVSYEARKLGIKRGMRISEIKQNFSSCNIVNSDYEIYDLFSQKMFSILRTFTPTVEEYSIDEAFADLKGSLDVFANKEAKYMNFCSPTCVKELAREKNFFTLGGNKNSYTSDFLLKKSYGYFYICQTIKSQIESSLGITVSVGLSLTKSLAKLASNSQKPSGLTIVDGPHIEKLLENTPVINVWGIGPQTSAYLNKLNIYTALDFALKSEKFITSYLSKPFYEIWQELRGNQVYTLNTEEKNTYRSITRSQTFYPPITDPDILWARLVTHIEDAFSKARTLNYNIGKIIILLKTQKFKYHTYEIKLEIKTSYPLLVKPQIKQAFYNIFQPNTPYRTTGCTITDLEDNSISQPSLFQDKFKEERTKKIYSLYEKKKVDFGSSLFDKKIIIKQKQKKKLNLPFIDISALSY